MRESEESMPNAVEAVAKERPAANEAPEPQGKSRAKFAILVLLVVVAGAAVATWLHYQDRVSTDDATVDGHITAIAPKISGTVVDVEVLDNQPVKAGQVLVRIDPRDYQAKVDLAKAGVQQAEGQVNSARAVVPWTNDTTQSVVAGAQAELANARADLERSRISAEQAAGSDLAYAQANVQARQANNDRAQADLSRMKPLLDKAEISSQQYDGYLAAARVAQSDLKAAQEKLASAQKEAEIRKATLAAAESRVAQAQAQVQNSVANRKQVPIRTTDVGTASAAVAAARANLEAADLQLSYTTIVAPIDGVVTRKSVEVGQTVAPGQSLMAIIPLNDVWVTANFKETQLAQVRAGQKAEIHVDMYGKSVTGHVDSIAGATGSRLSLLPPENATGNFVKVVQRIPVKILVDPQHDLVLRPGMNVDVSIFTK
jgi:membrane fusion protein (multidrug efflux system)